MGARVSAAMKALRGLLTMSSTRSYRPARSFVYWRSCDTTELRSISITRSTSGFAPRSAPTPRETSTSIFAEGSPARSARSAGVVSRRSPAARCRSTSTRRTQARSSRARTRSPSVRERASDRLERVPDPDPIETVHPRALVPMAGTAPDIAAEKLMSVALAVRKPDLGLRGPEDADGGHAERGARVKRASIHRDERVQRLDHGPGRAERKPPENGSVRGDSLRDLLLARPGEHDRARAEARHRADQRGKARLGPALRGPAVPGMDTDARRSRRERPIQARASLRALDVGERDPRRPGRGCDSQRLHEAQMMGDGGEGLSCRRDRMRVEMAAPAARGPHAHPGSRPRAEQGAPRIAVEVQDPVVSPGAELPEERGRGRHPGGEGAIQRQDAIHGRMAHGSLSRLRLREKIDRAGWKRFPDGLDDGERQDRVADSL